MSDIKHILTANSATLTDTASETVLDAYVIPAYSLVAGKKLRAEFAVVAPATNSTDTLNVFVRVGGTTLSGTAVITSGAVDVANDNVVTGYVDLVPRSAAGSSSGSVAAAGVCTAPGAIGTATARAQSAVVTGLDYRAPLRLELNAKWSVANAGNQCHATMFTVSETT